MIDLSSGGCGLAIDLSDRVYAAVLVVAVGVVVAILLLWWTILRVRQQLSDLSAKVLMQAAPARRRQPANKSPGKGTS